MFKFDEREKLDSAIIITFILVNVYAADYLYQLLARNNDWLSSNHFRQSSDKCIERKVLN